MSAHAGEPTSPDAQTAPAAHTSALLALGADARSVLQAWTPPSAAQAELRTRYLEHLAAEPLAAGRAGPPTHLTAGVLLLDATATRVLLTLHPKVGLWLQLGGHLEAEDSSLRAAALREASEESSITGITLSAAPIELHAHRLGARFGRCAEHLDVRYAGWAPEDAVPQISEESDELSWWPVNALPSQSDPDLPALVAAALAAPRP